MAHVTGGGKAIEPKKFIKASDKKSCKRVWIASSMRHVVLTYFSIFAHFIKSK